MCYFAAILKRISLKKLVKKVEKSKSGGSVVVPTPTKGVVISEKRLREGPSNSLSKKGRVVDSPKGKEVATAPEPKKKATRPGDAACSRAIPSPKLGDGSSPNPGTVLGPEAFIMGSPSIAEKILRGVIPPADKEKVKKLSLDQTATKLFHVIGWVPPRFCT